MGDNPLAPLVKNLNLGVGLGSWTCAAINVVLLFALCPVDFQRLGSVWVTVAILVFGAWRFILGQLNLALEGRGLMLGQLEAMLDTVAIREKKGWLNYVTEDGQVIENPPSLHEREVRSFLRDATAKLEGRLFGPEWALLLVGTLQWGYGDLFSTFVNGERLTSC